MQRLVVLLRVQQRLRRRQRSWAVHGGGRRRVRGYRNFRQGTGAAGCQAPLQRRQVRVLRGRLLQVLLLQGARAEFRPETAAAPGAAGAAAAAAAAAVAAAAAARRKDSQGGLIGACSALGSVLQKV